MADYIYTLQGMTKVQPPDKKVLEDVYLSFLPVVKIGVIGFNGSGKSSLLRIMAGQDKSGVPFSVRRRSAGRRRRTRSAPRSSLAPAGILHATPFRVLGTPLGVVARRLRTGSTRPPRASPAGRLDTDHRPTYPFVTPKRGCGLDRRSWCPRWALCALSQQSLGTEPMRGKDAGR